MGVITDTGALAINTGKFTGRSPKDRFIVKDAKTKDTVWWGDINIAFDENKFESLYNKVISYFEGRDLYVRDASACSMDKYKLKLRVINELPWSNQFAGNMFIDPKESELKDFNPEWHIINAPGFEADPSVDGTRQSNFAVINFTKKMILIGGTGYTGEIKKGIFSVLNYILPQEKNTLSMHCSANVGDQGDTAIFFGLSGTGKTTLSADPKRHLIGDDEHGWADNTVFNFEGGCYAKCIDLSEEKEPDIWKAIKPGAILENVIFHENSNKVDFSKGDITENTRVSYPINFINNIADGSKGDNPKKYIFPNCRCFWSSTSNFKVK
jgi:phosphoenolpyruvate carboxykinase (ATP)